MMELTLAERINYKSIFDKFDNVNDIINEILRRYYLPLDRFIKNDYDEDDCWDYIFSLSVSMMGDIEEKINRICCFDDNGEEYDDETKKEMYMSSDEVYDEIDKLHNIFDNCNKRNKSMESVIKYVIRPLVAKLKCHKSIICDV